MPSILGLSLKLPYLALNLVFMAAWGLTLVGLAVVQNRCSDHSAAIVNSFVTFVQIGGNCRKFFQLPWFVLALNMVPVLLVVVAVVKPALAKGATTAFFAVLAPLDILLAHAFYNLAASKAIDGSGGKVLKGSDEQWYKVVLSGFAILAAMALLLILADGLLAGDAERKKTTGESYDDGRQGVSQPSSHMDHLEPRVVKVEPPRRQVDVVVDPVERRGTNPTYAAPAAVPAERYHDASATPSATRPDHVVGYIVEDPVTHQQRRV